MIIKKQKMIKLEEEKKQQEEIEKTRLLEEQKKKFLEWTTSFEDIELWSHWEFRRERYDKLMNRPGNKYVDGFGFEYFDPLNDREEIIITQIHKTDDTINIEMAIKEKSKDRNLNCTPAEFKFVFKLLGTNAQSILEDWEKQRGWLSWLTLKF